jgi:ABC-type multidrug transport system fused ATPase/permease subunit
VVPPCFLRTDSARQADRAPPPPLADGDDLGGAPLVEFRGVTIQYGERKVLDALDWTVKARAPSACCLLRFVGGLPFSVPALVLLYSTKRWAVMNAPAVYQHCADASSQRGENWVILGGNGAGKSTCVALANCTLSTFCTLVVCFSVTGFCLLYYFPALRNQLIGV